METLHSPEYHFLPELSPPFGGVPEGRGGFYLMHKPFGGVPEGRGGFPLPEVQGGVSAMQNSSIFTKSIKKIKLYSKNRGYVNKKASN